MKRDKTSMQNLLLYALGILPVVWLALLLAPYTGRGLAGITEGRNEALASRNLSMTPFECP